MTLAKTEKNIYIVYNLTRPQSRRERGVMEREKGGRLSLSSFLSHPSRR